MGPRRACAPGAPAVRSATNPQSQLRRASPFSRGQRARSPVNPLLNVGTPKGRRDCPSAEATSTLFIQLILSVHNEQRGLEFHKLLEGKLPLTIGSGIGQSHLRMLLGKALIGEVQASIWDEETIAACRSTGVVLL